ncbi:MAG: DUF4105 domain-containing protein [Bdellovibrionota bacterium]
MKLFLSSIAICLVLDCLTLNKAQSENLTLPTYLPNSCIIDVNDPYEPDVKMTAGPLKDFCVNPLTRRSVEILSDFEAARYFIPLAGTLTVANFSHLGKFWVAQIPVAQVQKLKMQIEYFPIIKFPKLDIAHTQFLFEFKEGSKILLAPQVKNSFVSATHVELKKMIFSVENIGPYGEKFAALKGLKGHYNIAYRAISLHDKFKWMVSEQKHIVSQKLLALTPEQVYIVLMESLNRGSYWSTTRAYNTIRPNCVSELFSILDAALNLKNFYVPFIPNFAPQALSSRGLLEKNIQLLNLNEEYDGKP